MNGLTPADLGALDVDDEAVSTTASDELPTADLPPRPADLRSKEGRAWKKAAEAAGVNTKAEKLEGGPSLSSSAPRRSSKRNVEHFKKVLLSSHMKAALVTGIEEIAIDDDEATMLAESVAELLSYYKIKVDGKSGAVLALLYAVTMVYGSRLLPYILPNILAIFKREPTPEPPNNVVRANFSE